eukprot:PhM_4_TR5574/c0_g1_i1/m.5877
MSTSDMELPVPRTSSPPPPTPPSPTARTESSLNTTPPRGTTSSAANRNVTPPPSAVVRTGAPPSAMSTSASTSSVSSLNNVPHENGVNNGSNNSNFLGAMAISQAELTRTLEILRADRDAMRRRAEDLEAKLKVYEEREAENAAAVAAAARASLSPRKGTGRAPSPRPVSPGPSTVRGASSIRVAPFTRSVSSSIYPPSSTGAGSSDSRAVRRPSYLQPTAASTGRADRARSPVPRFSSNTVLPGASPATERIMKNMLIRSRSHSPNTSVASNGSWAPWRNASPQPLGGQAHYILKKHLDERKALVPKPVPKPAMDKSVGRRRSVSANPVTGSGTATPKTPTTETTAAVTTTPRPSRRQAVTVNSKATVSRLSGAAANVTGPLPKQRNVVVRPHTTASSSTTRTLVPSTGQEFPRPKAMGQFAEKQQFSSAVESLLWQTSK